MVMQKNACSSLSQWLPHRPEACALSRDVESVCAGTRGVLGQLEDCRREVRPRPVMGLLTVTSKHTRDLEAV